MSQPLYNYAIKFWICVDEPQGGKVCCLVLLEQSNRGACNGGLNKCWLWCGESGDVARSCCVNGITTVLLYYYVAVLYYLGYMLTNVTTDTTSHIIIPRNLRCSLSHAFLIYLTFYYTTSSSLQFYILSMAVSLQLHHTISHNVFI